VHLLDFQASQYSRRPSQLLGSEIDLGGSQGDRVTAQWSYRTEASSHLTLVQISRPIRRKSLTGSWSGDLLAIEDELGSEFQSLLTN